MSTPRHQALATLEEGHRAVAELLAAMSDEELERPATIGGGDWSAKDLAAHLAEWESHAVGAIAQWRRGERPDALDLTDERVDRLNAEAIALHRPHPSRAARARFESTYGTLVEAIDGLSDEDWEASIPSAEGAISLGELIGGVLGGPSGTFDHTAAHLGHLRDYARSLRTKS